MIVKETEIIAKKHKLIGSKHTENTLVTAVRDQGATGKTITPQESNQLARALNIIGPNQSLSEKEKGLFAALYNAANK